MVVRAAVAMVLVGLAGCSSPSDDTACTEIGCSDGLTVELTGGVPASYSVIVEPLDGSGAPQTVDCAASPCGNAVFVSMTPAVVRVSVATAADTVTVVFSPNYQTTRPNGPGCPPECRQATVQVAL